MMPEDESELGTAKVGTVQEDAETLMPEDFEAPREARLRLGRDVPMGDDVVYLELELSTSFTRGGSELAFDQLRKEVVEQLADQGRKLATYNKLEEKGDK